MTKYLKWRACPLYCAWDYNPPLCSRPECPIVPEVVEKDEDDCLENNL